MEKTPLFLEKMGGSHVQLTFTYLDSCRGRAVGGRIVVNVRLPAVFGDVKSESCCTFQPFIFILFRSTLQGIFIILQHSFLLYPSAPNTLRGV